MGGGGGGGTIIAHAQILTAPRPVIGVYVQISECSHLSTPEVRLPFLRICVFRQDRTCNFCFR